MVRKIHLSILTLLCAATASANPFPALKLEPAHPRASRLAKIAIPAEMNPLVREWIFYFAIQDHDRFDRYLTAGAYYKTLIQDILVHHGVPPEMYYLALIESGFHTRARSAAHAVGIWQFERSTARLYGLRADRYVDERLDLIRSTHAAARYLKDLRNEFGSWYLAMAAYNAGPGRIRRAIRVGHSRNYWKLVARGALPQETAAYVPKFQAAMYIAVHPERFGFERRAGFEFPRVRRKHFPASMPLETIARRTGIPVKTIRSLNPNLLAEYTPPNHGGYPLWIPLRSL